MWGKFRKIFLGMLKMYRKYFWKFTIFWWKISLYFLDRSIFFEKLGNFFEHQGRSEIWLGIDWDHSQSPKIILSGKISRLKKNVFQNMRRSSIPPLTAALELVSIMLFLQSASKQHSRMLTVLTLFLYRWTHIQGMINWTHSIALIHSSVYSILNLTLVNPLGSTRVRTVREWSWLPVHATSGSMQSQELLSQMSNNYDPHSLFPFW